MKSCKGLVKNFDKYYSCKLLTELTVDGVPYCRVCRQFKNPLPDKNKHIDE